MISCKEWVLPQFWNVNCFIWNQTSLVGVLPYILSHREYSFQVELAHRCRREIQDLLYVPCNGVVSHGAPIGGIRVFANHTQNKRKQKRVQDLCAASHAQTTADGHSLIECTLVAICYWFKPWLIHLVKSSQVKLDYSKLEIMHIITDLGYGTCFVLWSHQSVVHNQLTWQRTKSNMHQHLSVSVHIIALAVIHWIKMLHREWVTKTELHNMSIYLEFILPLW